jgi:hypothetical protein
MIAAMRAIVMILGTRRSGFLAIAGENRNGGQGSRCLTPVRAGTPT